jgi:hypothetical protein
VKLICLSRLKVGEKRGACRALVGKPAGKRLLEDTVVDRMIILK